MNIGLRIKQERKKAGLTQVQLADRAGISRSYLGDIEGNRYHASVETLQSIAGVFRIPVAALLSEEGEADGATPVSEGERERFDADILKALDRLTDRQLDDVYRFIRKMVEEKP